MGLRVRSLKGTGEDYIMRIIMICNHHHIYLGDQIEHNIMGKARDMHGACRVLFGKSNLEAPDVLRRRIFRHTVHLVQDRDKRWPLVNTVIELLVS